MSTSDSSRFTSLSIDVYAYTTESFMGDGTTLSLEITTHINRLNASVPHEQGGIVNRLSQHLSVAEAEELLRKLQRALSQVEVAEVA